MLVATTATVTGIPRARFESFSRAIRRRARRGSKVELFQMSVVRRDDGEVTVLAHWKTHNPDPYEAEERIWDIAHQALIEVGLRDCEVTTAIDD